MHERLNHKQSAAMLALMVLGREVPNPQLRKEVGFALDGDDRRTLNDKGYVDSRKSGRAFAHQLTDGGWAWCEAEFAAPHPPKPVRSTLLAAVYLVLNGLGEYLRQHDLRPAHVFAGEPGDAPPGVDVEELIRTAYRKLVRSPRGWVGLADLRPQLGGVAAAEVDVVLKQLSLSGQAHLVPESNRKALTDADREAAVRIGGEDNHLLSFEAS